MSEQKKESLDVLFTNLMGKGVHADALRARLVEMEQRIEKLEKAKSKK